MKAKRILAILLVCVMISADVMAIAEEVLNVLKLPSALKVIEEEAFYGNTSIEKVVVPEGATKIESNAFADSSLVEIELPESLKTISGDAFDGIEELAISAPEGSYAYDWAVEQGFITLESPVEDFEYSLENDECTITKYLGSGPNVVIPSVIEGCPVRYIGSSAFEEDFNIVSVILPEGIISIEPYAFAYCENMRYLTLPNGLVSIGDSAFIYCSIEEIILPDSLEEIGESAFKGCFFNDVNIPSAVTNIGNSAFSYCGELESITVDSTNPVYTGEDGVLFTKDMNTLLCYPAGKEMDRYFVPESVTTLGDSAFEKCFGLLSLVLPEGLVTIGDYAISTEFHYIYIPASVNYIGEQHTDARAFYGVSGSYAEEYAAEWEIPFYTDEMPDSYITPEEYFEYEIIDGECIIWAFYREIGSVFVPETIEGAPVTTIDIYAFGENYALKNVYLPKTVTSIAPDAFENSGNLRKIEVDEENPVYASVNGVLYTKDLKTLLYCPASGNFDFEAVLNGVTTIGEFAFNCNNVMTSFDIPESVTSIGANAFSCCWYLTDITIPETVTYIGEGAFGGCEELEQIVLPDSISRIENETFAWCYKLKDVTIPETVTYIGEYAFRDCALVSINIPAAVEEIASSAFAYCSKLTDIHVAEENENYIVVDGVLFSKDMKTLLRYPCKTEEHSYTIPDGVETISNCAFLYDRTGMTNITIPESVTLIEDDAFLSYDYTDINFDVIAPEGSYAYDWAEEQGILLENIVLESDHPYAKNADETWS